MGLGMLQTLPSAILPDRESRRGPTHERTRHMLVQLRLVVNLFMYDTIPSSVGECKTKSSTNLGLKLHLSYGSEIVPPRPYGERRRGDVLIRETRQRLKDVSDRGKENNPRPSLGKLGKQDIPASGSA
ncbi:hypothetical protein PSTT_00995 [Puccinia striiformis]|uniref:Uncharacterized protein n=1 Tax=Puccinia striiformis TaxID=27350 RepID=A0A2S4W574_9BASI|nr:hypothetical protein PSTT_00995 [Puccinia striiformis]